MAFTNKDYTVLRFTSAFAFTVLLSPMLRADDWPQWMGPQRDAIWRETGILDKFPEGGPKVLWRKPLAYGYAGPAVADGKVYVLDFKTDKMPKVNAGARSKVPGTERIVCLRASDGELIWKHEYEITYHISYPGGPRATPTVDAGKVYTLGADGNLTCLDAIKGNVIWSNDLEKTYETKSPLWGYAGHPLVVEDKLICMAGGKGSAVVAFDKNTGKEIWKALTTKDIGYSPPTLIEAGGVKQLLIWHSESINSLNPKTGEVYWSVPLAPQFGMSIMAPRQHGDYLFAGGVGGKAVLLKLAKDKPAAEEVWRGKNTTAVYPVNTTPFLENGLIYGIGNDGYLRGIELETGKRLWETFAPVTGNERANSGTSFMVKNVDRFFFASETGELVIGTLSAAGYEEGSRWKMLAPTGDGFGRPIVWSHPAFANRCIYARNDREIVCVSLAK